MPSSRDRTTPPKTSREGDEREGVPEESVRSSLEGSEGAPPISELPEGPPAEPGEPPALDVPAEGPPPVGPLEVSWPGDAPAEVPSPVEEPVEVSPLEELVEIPSVPPPARPSSGRERRRRRDPMPWFPEPLAPLHKILPEHIAYVRVVVARFGVTPTHWREDLVQEVLLQAYRSRDSRLDVRALLNGITRHIVLKWIRRRAAERTAVSLHVQPAMLATERNAEDEWLGAQRRQSVRAAIEELPVLFREVFIGSEIEHRTMPEVARALGIPVNTGYTRLHVARGRFLQSLQRHFARRGIGRDDLCAPVLIGAAALEGAAGGEAPPPPAPPSPPPQIGLTGKAWALGKLGPLIAGGFVTATAVVVVVGLSLPPAPEPPPAIATPEPRSPPSSIEEWTPPQRASASLPSPPPAPQIPRSPLPDASARVHWPIESPPEVAEASEARAAASALSAEEAARIAEGLAARNVLNLIKGGQTRDAVLAAEDFRSKYPASPYTWSIQKALGEHDTAADTR